MRSDFSPFFTLCFHMTHASQTVLKANVAELKQLMSARVICSVIGYMDSYRLLSIIFHEIH